MYIRAISRAALLCSTILSFNAFAAADRVDYDLDDDGLIEINDLADLNEIRNHLDGAALYGDSTGCPEGGCNGFELTTDLDFDTNGDGQMNELDTYWNDGEGWEPVGSSSSNAFTAAFNGNGHQIRNLYTNGTDNAGLFGYIKGTSNQRVQITRVAITGPFTSVSGRYDTGVLAGRVENTRLDRVFVTGTVSARRYAGGLAGQVLDSSVSNVFSSATILTGGRRGGMIGILNRSILTTSLSTGFVDKGDGLISFGSNNDNAHLHWATDTSGQETSHGTNASYFGALLSELQCPTSSGNDTCTGTGTLYEGWSSDVWDFGTGQQLPGLIMGGRVYRDIDGDGALDEDDAYPETFAASLDTDKDGYPDSYSQGCDSTCALESGLSPDAYPENSAGWLDADLDGLVDEWADGCDTTCQIDSGLSYDDYPDDHDNDGITDAVDTDDNNDGIIDADADSDGLIDIASLQELNAIRFALDGSGQAMIEGGLPDTSGCPIILWQGIAQQRCHGYELVSDLDFDTNGDGQMNELDTYWNDGEGWKPIGSFYSPFSADFHGNGHQIRNLYIDKSGSIGLFSYITGTPDRPATITQVAIIGPLTSITDRMTFSTGINDAGILVARVSHAEIDSIFVTGVVDSPAHSGGLAAQASNSAITNIFSSAAALTGNNQGGLIGYLSRSTLSNSLSTGYADSDSGLLNHSDRSNNESLYWAINTSGQTTSAGTNASYFGALLSELQCPTTANNNTCTDKGSLYENWNSEVWDFGTEQQLPALIMGNRIYRDSDGDGVLDKNDAFPDNFAASIDIDGDRAPDRWTTGCDAICTEQSELTFDAFPSSAAAHLDGDLDGLVDEWADDCDVNCQANSGLTFDDYAGDRDNDGIHDTIDTDDNNDGIIDADIDSNGLIDVASLEELNAIRFALDGSGQVMIEGSLPDTSGCPVILRESIAQQLCRGYELVSDLDFDTNGDGQMNELDTYWNNGEGWEPIGFSERNPFSSIFDGKGHQIRNIYSVSDSYGKGLFGYATNSVLSNLVLNGPLTRITGRSTIGILAGKLSNSSVYSVYTAGDILASGMWSNAGGVAGMVSGASLQNIHSATVIEGSERVGGVVGYAYSGARITQVLATGEITGPNSNSKGGIVGIFLEPHDASSSYWATDTSGQTTSASTNASYFGALLSELQCPTSSDNSTCTDKGTLYENWDSEVWDFGSNRQLPGLIMNGVVYRDSDGDGALDEEDAYPDTFAASLDTDKDGYPDNYSRGCSSTCVVESGLFFDAFPDNSAGGLDADLDGLVDKWADSCDTTCQTSSGLTFDDYPNDHDNDGISDAIDTDDNNDGIVDADADSDGLIDIASLEELNAIRFALDGSGQIMIDEGLWDNSGCPIILWEGIAQQRCHGYELIADLDFDTNGDGQMNELDTYWNDGEGWEPIGLSTSAAFSTNFNGNGHRISNLYVDRFGYSGLFGHIVGTSKQLVEVTRVAITGPMTSITGSYHVGILAGSVTYAEIDSVFVSGVVNGGRNGGGLAGRTSDSSVSNVFSSADILEGGQQGGILGGAYRSYLSNSLSTGYVKSGGGLLSYSSSNDNSYLYWATDTSSQTTSEGTNASYFGALLNELQCPTAPNDDTCTDKGTLYENWDNEVWDFGSDRQLPGLIMNGVVYRDSDGDGTLDVNLNAPSVALILTQAGREEATIVEGMGDVTIEAIISDEDDWDAHFIEWSSNDINLSASYEFGNSITFSSDGLVAGDYTISATVTDNGIPQLSDAAEMTIRVISNVDSAPAASSGGGGSGGGAMLWLLALLSAPLLIGRVRA